MGLILAPDEIKTNVNTLSSYLNSMAERYRNVQERVHEYHDEEELDAESWNESQNRLDIFYNLTAESMLSVQESIINDIDMLTGCIGDEYLDEDELNRQIERLREQCLAYEERIEEWNRMGFVFSDARCAGCIGDLTEIYREAIENMKEQIAVLQEKLIFLHESEDLTVNLFQSVTGMILTIRNAISEGSVSVNTDAGFSGSPEWLTVLAGKQIEIPRSVGIGNYPEAYLDMLASYEAGKMVNGRFVLYNNGLTIAYGHDVRDGEDFSNGISEAEGRALAVRDLDEKYRTIEYYANLLNENYGYDININDFTDNEILFLLDFTYNRGTGFVEQIDLKAEGKPYSSLPVLIVAVSEKDDVRIEKVLMEEVYNPNGEYREGLKLRRMDEYELLKFGDYERDYDVNRDYTQPKK